MPKERCPDDQHDWYCRSRGGVLGESMTELHLSPEQVQLVLQDSRQAPVVCPDGIIICGKCEDTIPPGQTLKSPQFDFEDLSNRIIKD